MQTHYLKRANRRYAVNDETVEGTLVAPPAPPPAVPLSIDGGIKSYWDTASIVTITSTQNISVTGSGTVKVLLVGGGGGASQGGGGGGGFIYRNDYQLEEGVYTVTIGVGGLGEKTDGGSPDRPSGNGSASVFIDLRAEGGGGGGGVVNSNGQDGGSGGGIGPYATGFSAGQAISSSAQGSNGGYGDGTINPPYPAAGGGGAGAVGGDYADGGICGNGGNGLICNINGTSSYYAGGGGGANYQAGTDGTGGLGGGGNPLGGAGGVNTGGGGGGNRSFQFGGNGGSGICIISYTT